VPRILELLAAKLEPLSYLPEPLFMVCLVTALLALGLLTALPMALVFQLLRRVITGRGAIGMLPPDPFQKTVGLWFLALLPVILLLSALMHSYPLIAIVAVGIAAIVIGRHAKSRAETKIRE